ncbi:MAG: flippase [Sulfurisoma sp.]|nr:flippase [Sulfurisoma sp.]
MRAAGRLSGNILWNLAGGTLPLAVGLVAFPVLLQGLGVERFGILAIAWLLVGYFGLFDMGLSRALTQFVAERIGAGEREEAAAAASTALSLMWGLGVVAAALTWLPAPWLAGELLAMPAGLRQEATDAFHLLALSLPLVVHTAGLRGILEAHHDFRAASMLRLFLGVTTFIAPMAVLPFGGDLVHAVSALLVVRGVAWILHRRAARAHMPEAFGRVAIDRRWLKPLLGFGGWMTITNIVGPLMVYFDRFVIGAALSVAAVGYYTAPYEIVTRLTLVTTAIAGVLFPLFAAHWRRAPQEAAHLLQRGLVHSTILLAPALAFLSWLAPELLTLWLGPVHATEGAAVLRLLAVGAFMNGLAQILFALIQGAGRPQWTAKLHLAEALPYWLALLWLLDRHGIAGAAAAWSLRASIDALALWWFAGKVAPEIRAATRAPAWLALAASAIIGVPLLLDVTAYRYMAMIVGLPLFSWFAWSRLITLPERDWLAARLARRGR